MKHTFRLWQYKAHLPNIHPQLNPQEELKSIDGKKKSFCPQFKSINSSFDTQAMPQMLNFPTNINLMNLINKIMLNRRAF
ncbi:hypothetical protein Peur_013728 [Populus x canadensis]